MQFSDMRAFVLGVLGEANSGWYTVSILNAHINASLREIYGLMVKGSQNYFVTTANVSLVANQELYTLPAGIHKLVLVERVDLGQEVPVIPVDITQRSRYLYSSTNPIVGQISTRYYLRGNNLGIVPIPTDASANALRLYYTPTATNLVADGDTPPAEWPELHHEVICWGAVVRLVMRDKALYQQFSPNFERLLKACIEDTQLRVTQEPRMIIDTDEDN